MWKAWSPESLGRILCNNDEKDTTFTLNVEGRSLQRPRAQEMKLEIYLYSKNLNAADAKKCKDPRMFRVPFAS